MSRPNWLLTFIKVIFPRDPKQGKITKFAPIGNWLEKKFFEGDHMITVPRDVVVNQSVEEPDQMVLPSELLDHFIDAMEQHVIMNFCICRKSMPCKDYPIELGCLFMGEAVTDINPEWGRRVTREEAKAHMRKCEEEGLIHFIGKSKLDTQWLGIGPGEKLLTICNCCPCCCITRGLPYAAENLSSKLVKAPGVNVVVTEDCIGCEKCVKEEVCFANALQMNGDKAVIGDTCRGCGRCIAVCDQGAIKITIDRDLYMNKSIEQISRVVDVP